MAAYAALLSLRHVIDQIQHHPRPPISLNKKQVESLTEKIGFLQDFLECYSHVGNSKEADDFENRIADAACAAEDIIESHIVDQILAGPKSRGKKIRSFNCFQGLKKVIQDMDLIKKEVMGIKEKTGVQDQLLRNSRPAGSSRSSSTGQSIMVGFDAVLYEIMDQLTGQQCNLQIIPIVGMGGIGKTTLARNIYQNQTVVQHFDTLAWVTISQEYEMREILVELLCPENKEDKESKERRKKLSQMNEKQLGDDLHKSLFGRRYLVIMDDIWDIEVWDQLKFIFPDNNIGSRIMLTTRLSNLASQVVDSQGIDMPFIDEDNSWNLFSKVVFGEEGCPLEQEEIGKKIVKSCKGLPLSIVVIGGLLAKSRHTQEYWEYIEENLNSIVNSEDNERHLKTLRISYSQLPIYLKPCFLYMGVFSEDSVIRVSTLIKLWVAEGFVKPIRGKSLEVVAAEYLKDLIDRNLILVHKLGSIGNIKYCKLHNLLRDLCLKEAQKGRFYNVLRQHSLNLPQAVNTHRRIVIPKGTSKKKVFDALQSMPLARSLLYDIKGVLPSLNFRLLRILKTIDKDSPYMSGDGYFLENMSQLVNSRYLAVKTHMASKFPSSIHLFWNLHTLIVDNDYSKSFIAPAEIWNMPQLRHVEFVRGLYLQDPPSGRRDGIVLGNLQTLLHVYDFKCGEELVKRIPNIKRLEISYWGAESKYYLNNLDCLHKLESFHCGCFALHKTSETYILQNLTFPRSLKKLTLKADHIHWEDMLQKIGPLPLLEKLQLVGGSFKGRKWETVEGQFRSLKFLEIASCGDFEYWTTESSHFPRLEHLFLSELEELKEIPSEIGEIPTLQAIDLEYCRDSAIISAERVLEEQEELHGKVGIQVRVTLFRKNEALESLANPNFHVRCWTFS